MAIGVENRSFCVALAAQGDLLNHFSWGHVYGRCVSFILFTRTSSAYAGRDIRISNQFVITRAHNFAQPRCTTTPTVLSSKRNYHIGSQSII